MTAPAPAEHPPSYEWSELGDAIYYHKTSVYKLEWNDLDLAGCVVASARYGGAIAVTRNEEHFQQYKSNTLPKGSVQIYSCDGMLIQDLKWDFVTIRALGWTEDEHLIVVTKSGVVRAYDLLGDFSQFTLQKSESNVDVLDCRFWAAGMVARMSDAQFIRVDSYTEPKSHVMVTNIVPETIIYGWCIVEPAFTLSRCVECLIACNNTVISIDGTDVQSFSLEARTYTMLEVSANGQFCALRSSDGKITVLTIDMQQTLTEYDAGEDFAPHQLAWCGNDALIAATGTFLILIGPSGQTLQFAYDSHIFLATEVDGLRICTSREYDYVRKVPETSERIFSPGSDSAAAILLDAIDQLEARSAKADENIRLIQPYLIEAVDDCIRAAAESTSTHWQKQLLKAASFGKGFLDLYSTDEFVHICDSLRVINALREEVKIPLTYEQYMRITPEALIHRLLQRKFHFLALRISDFLHLPADDVYIHWACLKLHTSEEDAQSTCATIVKKLSDLKQVSYERIARAAYRDGRVDLAQLLLQYDTRPAAQVPLLLDMGNSTVALDKAIESGDPDLIMYVMLAIKREKPLASFFKTINDKPDAVELFVKYAKRTDRQLLRDFYYQDDRKLDSALAVLHESMEQSDAAQRLNKVKIAARMMKESKEHTFEAKVLDDHIRLLQLQEVLTKEYNVQFSGLSIAEILFKLHTLGHSSRASKIVSSFRVSDLTSSWIQIRAFIHARDWNALERFTSKMGKKPIIPIDQIALAVHASGNISLFTTLLSRALPQARLDTYLLIEDWSAAAIEAKALGDQETLDLCITRTTLV